MNQTLGLVGLGLMGSAFTRRLISAGYKVVGYDISEDRRREFATLGGTVVQSLDEVAQAGDVILLSVMTIQQVGDVVEGNGGLVKNLTSPEDKKIVLCTITAEPEALIALAERVKIKGIELLDTPVSGTSQQLLQGDGLGLIAGNKEAIKEVQPVLDVIYPRQCYTGPVGTGTKTKLAINHILGLNRVALAEGLVFAERMDLDLSNFLDTARQSAAYSQIMDVKGNKMIDREFTPAGKISQHLKDFRIIRQLAENLSQQLPFAQKLIEILEACERRGDGDQDNAISIEEIRRRRIQI